MKNCLVAFYKLRDIVLSIRGPFSYGDEGATRKRREHESEPEATARDSFYVPIARMQKQTEFLSDLISKKYRAQAVFKRDIQRAFVLANEVLNTIQIASGMLVEQVGQPRADPEFWRKLEGQIWNTSTPDKPDELSQKIDQAIEIVEAAVRPALEKSQAGSSSKPFPFRGQMGKARSGGSHSTFHEHKRSG